MKFKFETKRAECLQAIVHFGTIYLYISTELLLYYRTEIIVLTWQCSFSY